LRCPFYEEDIYDGVVAQINCENPEVYQNYGLTGKLICPYGEEYECNIPIHLCNLEEKK
jgi:hypothetical protein